MLFYLNLYRTHDRTPGVERRGRGDGARARGGVKQLPQQHARKQLAKYLHVTRSRELSAEFPPLQVWRLSQRDRDDVCDTDACGREDALRFVRCSVASLEPLACM